LFSPVPSGSWCDTPEKGHDPILPFDTAQFKLETGGRGDHLHCSESYVSFLTGQLFDEAGLISEQPSVSEQLPLVEQRLVQTHRELGTNLQLQRRNINLIEEDMNQYPLNIASEVLRPQISQIKVTVAKPTCCKLLLCVL
jgi:hypothetical protein